ncbi:MAG: nucleotidyltransferase domain-containing protein [Caldilineaceae bacterium]
MSEASFANEMQLPNLAEPYQQGLRLAIDYILERYSPLGLIVGGSIIRGNPGPTSDFDIYVIHNQPFRQRLQIRFNGTPAEIFVNSPAAVRRYFEDEWKAGRPITAHILTTGVVALNQDPLVDQLIHEAQEWLAKCPALSDAELLWKRYLIVDGLDNARDLIDNDSANAAFFLHDAVQAMLNYYFLAANQNLPRYKEIVATLEKTHPDLGGLVRSYYGASEPKQQLALAEQIALLTIGTTEFFEWESAQEVYPRD